MARTLPSLHLFSIFEASARHQSFKLASEELFLTPSAVSHQVKALEEFVGFDLFARKGRGVSLNTAGKMYLEYVQKSLTLLEQGTKAVKNKFSNPKLTISTFPSMASNVIIPQLSLFQQQHPEIDISIETSMGVSDIRYDDIDLALRVGDGEWQGATAIKLFDLNVAALCSPAFALEHNITSVQQVQSLPLIDFLTIEHVWQTWAKAAGIKGKLPDHKLTFSNYDAALRAAEQGLGLTLAMMPIENSLVQRNILINPFASLMPFGKSLYAVYKKENDGRHDIQCFIDWLMKSPNLSM